MRVSPEYARAIDCCIEKAGYVGTIPERVWTETSKNYDIRSSMRSSAAKAGAQNLLTRFSPISPPKSIAPAINMGIRTPRRLSHQSTQARKSKKCITNSQSGIFKPRGISKRDKIHAETKLRRNRIILQASILFDNDNRHADGELKWSVRCKINMLGCLDHEGEILYMPKADWATWLDPRDIEEVRDYMFRPSPLRHMERIVTEREIREQKVKEVMEFMQKGPQKGSKTNPQGVWRELQGPQFDVYIEVVAKWAWKQELEAQRAREASVMDPTCRFWTAYASRGA